jgi:hypothetical protein
VLDPEGERPSTRYICDRRNPTLLDARSFKSFRPVSRNLGAIAAATKPESDVHAAIRSSRAVRNNPLRKEGEMRWSKFVGPLLIQLFMPSLSMTPTTFRHGATIATARS